MAHGGFHIPDATPLSEGYGVGGIQAFGTAGGVSRLLHRRVLCMLDAMRLGLISSISLPLVSLLDAGPCPILVALPQ